MKNIPIMMEINGSCSIKTKALQNIKQPTGTQTEQRRGRIGDDDGTEESGDHRSRSKRSSSLQIHSIQRIHSDRLRGERCHWRCLDRDAADDGAADPQRHVPILRFPVAEIGDRGISEVQSSSRLPQILRRPLRIDEAHQI